MNPASKIVPSLMVLALTASSAVAAPADEVEKTEQAALGYSLLGTLAPLAILVGGSAMGQPELAIAGGAGLIVGPSAGHWYAGDPFTAGLAMRGGGVVLVGAGLARALSNIDCEQSDCAAGAGLMTGAGMLLVVSGTLYDIATAGRAARRWNARQLQIGPTAIGPSSTPGLAIGGAF